jgi:KipI family sensor histidine kinase inhibitor
MDEALETPRLANPRTLIPAGSVGIAGKQTGAYSIDSPGGWQLIGRTPLRLFDPANTENPTLVDAGDWVRFQAIDEAKFKDIQSQVEAYKYVPEHIFEGGEA